MDPFTTSFFAGIAVTLTDKILTASGRSIRDRFKEPAEKEALKKCLDNGVVMLVADAVKEKPEERTVLAEFLQRLADHPDVGGELRHILGEEIPDMEGLSLLLKELGYDPDTFTFPGASFEQAITVFTAGFIEAAEREPTLQGIIQTKRLASVLQLSKETREDIRRVVELLDQSQPGSLLVNASGITVVIDGKQVVCEFRQAVIEKDDLKSAYLNHLFETIQRHSLAGIDPKAAADVETSFNLDAVYTALLTHARGDFDHREFDKGFRTSGKLSALEQLNDPKNNRLVLLGDPGSGKSTFVNFVTMCLAGEILNRKDANIRLLTTPMPDDEGDGEAKRQKWDHNTLLPVRIILRDYVVRGLPATGTTATADHLWCFITGELERANLGDYASHLRKELMAKGGLILLDGLDEVPEADSRRQQIKESVEAFAAVYSNCRFLITSRTYAYQEQKWRLSEFREAVLAPFSQGQIRQFVDRWYAHIGELRGLDPDDVQGKAELLKQAIFRGSRLLALAERPLLLTLMASLHAWRGGNLPEKREELYADTVDLLLEWWESLRVLRDAQGQVKVLQPSLAEWLKVDKTKVRNQINEIAYRCHERQQGFQGTADIAQTELVDGLISLTDDRDVKPLQLVEYLSHRAGLLVPRGVGVYTFPHRTFQEYLAACHLTDNDYPEMIADLVRKDPERWREVALLAGAKASRGTAAAIWLLVNALCYSSPTATNDSQDVWGAHIAGIALAEVADLDRIGRPNLATKDRIITWLVRIITEGLLPPRERAIAGESLARLGDPRFNAGFCHLPVDPALGFVGIPAGPFQMGTDKDNDPRSVESAQPQHEVSLPTYYISRYPVTVAQFRSFVEAASTRLQDPNCLKGVDNHPVVNVTWDEAIGYCRWLTEELRSRDDTPGPLGTLLREGDGHGPPWGITLPSEAEWEKAARGTDGRIYPWEGEANPNLANYDDTGIGTISAAGCFPGGASPYGCLDMAGNVWEWTRSLWGKEFSKPDFGYPYDSQDGREDEKVGHDIMRVLRGGAFNLPDGFMRCAFRYWNRPANGFWNLGFRIVLSPFYSDL